MKTLSVLFLTILFNGTNGFGVPNNAPGEKVMTRSNFVSVIAGSVTVGAYATPSWAAKNEDPSLKGTKKDPAFEACLSQCMYDCTKPKGVEQKSRLECLPECKQKCATNKNQLLRGEPIKAE